MSWRLVADLKKPPAVSDTASPKRAANQTNGDLMKTLDYSARLNLFTPPELAAAVAEAARAQMTSMSSYTRKALLEKLKVDGFELPKEAA